MLTDGSLGGDRVPRAGSLGEDESGERCMGVLREEPLGGEESGDRCMGVLREEQLGG